MAAKKQTSNDKNLMYALIVFVLVVVLAWALKTGAKNYGGPPVVTQNVEENTYPAISGSSDLDKASKALDAQDLSSIDKELGGLDADSASF